MTRGRSVDAALTHGPVTGQRLAGIDSAERGSVGGETANVSVCQVVDGCRTRCGPAFTLAVNRIGDAGAASRQWLKMLVGMST